MQHENPTFVHHVLLLGPFLLLTAPPSSAFLRSLSLCGSGFPLFFSLGVDAGGERVFKAEGDLVDDKDERSQRDAGGLA